jgi:hypothetical protein
LQRAACSLFPFNTPLVNDRLYIPSIIQIKQWRKQFMKKIFTLIAVLFSITTFAAPGPKTSKIAFSNNNRFTLQVKIDGVMYDLGSSLALDNIRSGNHAITIYKTDNFGFRKRSQVIYNSTLFISPAQLINIDINRYSKVDVTITSTDRFNRNGRYNNGRDNRGRDYDNRYGRH